MTRDATRQDTYVSRVLQDTEHCLLDLLKENESLRRNVAALESEMLSLGGHVARLRQDLARLRPGVVDRQAEADEHRGELDHLRGRLADVEAANRTLAERFERVTRQNEGFESLYVASYRLNDSLDRSELLLAIDEIIINLIGCEQFGVFELRRPKGEFSRPQDPVLGLVSSSRIDPERYRTIPFGDGPIGRAAATGESYLGAAAGRRAQSDDAPTACIPLKLGGRVTGAIVLFRLLPQKSDRLEDLDLELLDLLASRAASALCFSALYATHRKELEEAA